MKRTLLIDADIIIYRAAVVVQHDFSWDEEWEGEGEGEDDKSVVHCADFEEAKGIVEALLYRIHKRLGGEIKMCLSSPDNFRYTVLPSYKSNRKGKADPVLRQKLKQWVKDKYDSILLPQCEADDVLGIEQTRDTVICTIDKDLDQIPGKHYDWDNDYFYEVSEDEGQFFFYLQALKGDPVDGYGGCPSIGQKRAFKLLHPLKKKTRVKDRDRVLWEAILEQYEKKGLDEEFALQQARVARILTPELYNREKGEVILWKPTKSIEKNIKK